MGTPEQDLEEMYRKEEIEFAKYEPVEKQLDSTNDVWAGLYGAYDDLEEFRRLRAELEDMLDEAEGIVAVNCGQGDFAEPW